MKKNQNKTDYTNRPWNTLDALWLVLLCTIVAPLVTTLLAGILLALFRVTFSIQDTLEGNKYVLAFQYLMMYAVMLYIVWIYGKKNHVDVARSIRMQKPKSAVSVLWVMLLAVLSVFSCILLVNLMEYAFRLVGYQPESTSMPLATFGDFVLQIIFLALLPAVCEEIVYRGVILQGLKEKCKPILAIILTSVIFMLAHGSLQQTIYQFILGLLLTYIAYSTKSIVYSMIAHFTNNFIVILLGFIQNKTQPWIVDFSMWYNIVMAIAVFVIGVSLVILCVYLWKKYIWRTEKTEVVEVENSTLAKWTSKEIVMAVVALSALVVLWVIGTISGF